MTIFNPTKEFLKFCNDLRCPICQSQLDGQIGKTEARLYCVANYDEYGCNYDIDHNLLYERYQFIFDYRTEIYNIIQNKISLKDKPEANYHLQIFIDNGEIKPQYREKVRKILIDSYLEKPYLFNNRKRELTKEQFLKKIQIYNILS